jgi:hypothetical protein
VTAAALKLGSWSFGLYVVATWDLDHAKLYLIATVFLGVVTGLSTRDRRDGELSAYAMRNEGGQHIDGDTSLAAFGIRDVSNRGAGAVAGGGGGGGGAGAGVRMSPGQRLGGGGPVSTSAAASSPPVPRLDRYRAMLRPRFDGSAADTEAYMRRLAAAATRCKLHHKCLCGSGASFAACCHDLQLYLRETRFA